MPLSVVPEFAQERRGLDYATAVFVSTTDKNQQEVFDQVLEIADDVGSNFSFRQAGSSPHFEMVFINDLGLRIELSPATGRGVRNPGHICMTLPGSVFYTQEPERSAFNIWRIANIPEFKWFTRLDFQNTELSPEVNTDDVHQGVVDGKYWVKGYGTWKPFANLDPHMEAPDGRTIYWGSHRSDKLGRTYDKAKQSNWKEPAIRDELQTRGDWAKSFGRELKRGLDASTTGAEMAAAVSNLATSALNQHLLYFDLNGTDPKTDKNWTRKANPADWYLKRIGKHCNPIRKTQKAELDLESTVDWGLSQYGRYIYRWIVQEARRRNHDEELQFLALKGRLMSKLKEEDMEWLHPEADAEERAAHWQEILDIKDDVAFSQEHSWDRTIEGAPLLTGALSPHGGD